MGIKKDRLVAQDLGDKAFKLGVKRIAGVDPKFMELVTGKSTADRFTLYRFWYRGWDIANLRVE